MTIELEHVYKSYGDKAVLEDFSLVLGPGCTGLVGPSGRGKTTVAKLVLEAAGKSTDGGPARRRRAALFQEDRLLPHLSVYDNIALAGASDKDIRQMAAALEIDQVLEDFPEALSGGMKHRVALARAFLCQSNLLVLDEPFRGLDDELRDRIIDRLWDKVTAGRTVLLISHDIEICKKLSERIIYI